jgi:hypothetical protein
VVARGIAEKSVKPLCAIEAPTRIVIERLITKGGIPDTAGQTLQRILALGRVGARIGSVGRWGDGFKRRAECKTDAEQEDCKN